MVEKLISEVLAMLLMVVIVIGLVGVVSYFLFGFTRPIETKVEVRATSCIYPNMIFGGQTFTNGAIRLEITHIGTREFPLNQISIINIYDIKTNRIETANFASRTPYYVNETTKPSIENLVPGETIFYIINGTRRIGLGDSYKIVLSIAGQRYEALVTC